MAPRAIILRIVNTHGPSQTQGQAHPPPCRFLQLPAEIRLRIYGLLFAPYQKLLLQRHIPKRRRRRQAQSQGIHQCTQPIGRRGAHSLKTDWTRTNIGILLTKKQFYDEAVVELYKNLTIIFDKPFSLHYSFLRTVPANNLGLIKKITIQHRTCCDHETTAANKASLEASEAHMWRHIAASLPNLEELHIKLDVIEPYSDWICPDFDAHHQLGDTRTFYSYDQLNTISWLQPWRAFCGMPKLEKVKVDIEDYPNHHLPIFWALKYYKTAGNDVDTVCAKWGLFYERLHRTMERAIQDIILGRTMAWIEHMILLEKYYRWLHNIDQRTGLYADEGEETKAIHFEQYVGCKKAAMRRGACQHGINA